MLHETLTEEQFADFSAVISSHLGIRMPPGKRTMLHSRLQRRARQLGLASVGDYHRRFFSDPGVRQAELEHLLNLATTNKTDFLREPDHFDHLVNVTLPEWLKHRPSDVFRVWCAGCATGEEAYTLAMVLAEQQPRHGFDYSILATDVSTRALEYALAAVYPSEHVRPVPAPWRSRYLMQGRGDHAGLVRITPEIRQRVRFGHLNFLSEEYGVRQAMDAVFFRNVMIYFDRETQCTVVGRICRHLRVRGTLYIAHAETLQGQPLPIENIGKSVYRRLAGTPIPLAALAS